MIECGEIYYVKGTQSVGHEIWSNRPAIVISSRKSIMTQGTVNVIYLTSSENKKTFTVPIGEHAFTNRKKEYNNHVALCAQIHSVDKTRLGSYYGKVSKKELEQIKKIVEQNLFD